MENATDHENILKRPSQPRMKPTTKSAAEITAK